MKKIFGFALITMAFVGTLSMTSCSKEGDYSCTCTIDGQTTTTAPTHGKKSTIEAACKSLETTAQAQGFTASCSLN